MNLNMTKKIAAIGLASMMSGCMLSNSAVQNTISDSFTITASAATASGSCGSGLSWSLSGDTLTITGSGQKMTNYTSGNAPWKAYASAVKKVILPKTLKSIGNYAFYGMTALEYVYTKDGLNKPCFPDLTSIGKYAFANCYNFRGNTENGKMTFGLGTASVIESGKLKVYTRAFQNCDKVRFLYAEFSAITVDAYGFYSMDMLSSVLLSDTTITLADSTFKNCSALATVEYKPSSNTIHNNAFANTKYRTNSCTTTAPVSLNRGAATKLTDKQLVVNFFVDRTIVDLKNDYSNSRLRTLGTWESYTPNPGEIVCPFYQIYNNLQSTGVYRESAMTCSYAYGWNPQKISNQSNPSGNSVVTLNKMNFANQFDPNRISVSMAQNGVTGGFFGSYVESEDITERLNDVRAAMNDLKEQAAEYGASFTYEMHPETNFQITYDFFDWSTKPKYDYGPDGEYLGYDYAIAYDGKNPQVEAPRGVTQVGAAKVTGNKSTDKLFSSILNASKNLTGNKKQTIDMVRDSSGTSPYTQFLKRKYNVDSVIYLIHFNTASQAESRTGDMDEFSIICPMPNNANVPEITEHETAHLFGARDYYWQTGSMTPAQQYAHDYLGYELMKSNGTKVSPVTAFYLGWRTWLDTPTWNIFFGR